MSTIDEASEVRFDAGSIEQLRNTFEQQLRYRRLFVGSLPTVTIGARCSVVIEHPNGTHFSVVAEVVYVKPDEPGVGVGFELVGLDSVKLSELERFVLQTPEAATESDLQDTKASRSLYERIRQLGLREREVLAKRGNLTERVALERCFGSSVWEGLLQNPQLTAPEVAHIAKNGTLQIPLIAAITGNRSWLSSGEVRRALLSNPRTTGIPLERVLQAMPRMELKQLVQVSPYRAQVKAAAKKLLGDVG